MPREVCQENVGLELQEYNFFLCKVPSNKNAALMVYIVLKYAHGRLAKHYNIFFQFDENTYSEIWNLARLQLQNLL